MAILQCWHVQIGRSPSVSITESGNKRATASRTFSPRQAEDLERILLGVAEPGRERLVRAALSTELLGFTAQQLQASRRCAHGRSWWNSFAPPISGGASMLRRNDVSLLDTWHLCACLGVDGERRATNLGTFWSYYGGCGWRRRHWPDQVVGGTASFVARERGTVAARKATKIWYRFSATSPRVWNFHWSFAFMWDGRLRSDTRDTVIAHDASAGDEPVVDFGSSQRARLREQRRAKSAENLRLLYVALTRAKYRN